MITEQEHSTNPLIPSPLTPQKFTGPSPTSHYLAPPWLPTPSISIAPKTSLLTSASPTTASLPPTYIFLHSPAPIQPAAMVLFSTKPYTTHVLSVSPLSTPPLPWALASSLPPRSQPIPSWAYIPASTPSPSNSQQHRPHCPPLRPP
jgi:hypothetical protein